MPLFFELLEKDQVKETYKIFKGLKIGRTQGQILLNDTKVSGLHAFVEKNSKGQYLLVDRKSSNGIRINDRRVPRVLLLPGVVVQIGRTDLRVAELDKEADQPVRDWKKGVQKALTDSLKRSEIVENANIRALKPAIQLKFIQGIQLDVVYTLGYGPRRVGAVSLDLPVYEKNIPEEAFFIEPDENGYPVFRTEHPEVVTYNGLRVNHAKVQDGGIIEFGKTKIRIETIS